MRASPGASAAWGCRAHSRPERRSALELAPGPAAGPHAAPANALLHLIIRRGAKVAWEHHSDELEIHVQSDITTAEAKSHIEEHGRVSADFRLLFNGQVSAGRSCLLLLLLLLLCCRRGVLPADACAARRCCNPASL